MAIYPKYQMDFHGKKVLDKSSNWTLIGWKDSYENLKIYFENLNLNLKFISTKEFLNNEKKLITHNVIIASTFKRYPKEIKKELICKFSKKIIEQISNIISPNIIYISSSSVYGLSNSEDSFIETSLINPKSEYASEKIFFEKIIDHIIKGNNGKCIILRPSALFGKYKLLGKSTNLIDNIYESIHTNKKLNLKIENNGLQIRDFIHISDFLKIVSIFANNINQMQISMDTEIFNLSNNKKYRLRDILEIVKLNYKNITIDYQIDNNNFIHSSLNSNKLNNYLENYDFLQIENYI